MCYFFTAKHDKKISRNPKISFAASVIILSSDWNPKLNIAPTRSVYSVLETWNMSLQNFIHKNTAQTFAIYPLALASVNMVNECDKLQAKIDIFFCGNHEEKLSQKWRKSLWRKCGFVSLGEAKNVRCGYSQRKRSFYSEWNARISAKHDTNSVWRV